MLSLRPPLLDELGLAAALAAHCERFSVATGVTVECDLHDIDDQRHSPELEAALFRIAQESLTNVARHSGAGKAQVSIRRKDSQLELQVTDRGHGFDPKTMQWNSGLKGMRERATMLGGTLSVTSTPGHGTTVLAAVHISPED
jgi:signal transduction histidine kinase